MADAKTNFDILKNNLAVLNLQVFVCSFKDGYEMSKKSNPELNVFDYVFNGVDERLQLFAEFIQPMVDGREEIPNVYFFLKKVNDWNSNYYFDLDEIIYRYCGRVTEQLRKI